MSPEAEARREKVPTLPFPAPIRLPPPAPRVAVETNLIQRLDKDDGVPVRDVRCLTEEDFLTPVRPPARRHRVSSKEPESRGGICAWFLGCACAALLVVLLWRADIKLQRHLINQLPWPPQLPQPPSPPCDGGVSISSACWHLSNPGQSCVSFCAAVNASVLARDTINGARHAAVHAALAEHYMLAAHEERLSTELTRTETSCSTAGKVASSSSWVPIATYDMQAGEWSCDVQGATLVDLPSARYRSPCICTPLPAREPLGPARAAEIATSAIGGGLLLAVTLLLAGAALDIQWAALAPHIGSGELARRVRRGVCAAGGDALLAWLRRTWAGSSVARFVNRTVETAWESHLRRLWHAVQGDVLVAAVADILPCQRPAQRANDDDDDDGDERPPVRWAARPVDEEQSDGSGSSGREDGKRRTPQPMHASDQPTLPTGGVDEAMGLTRRVEILMLAAALPAADAYLSTTLLVADPGLLGMTAAFNLVAAALWAVGSIANGLAASGRLVSGELGLDLQVTDSSRLHPRPRICHRHRHHHRHRSHLSSFLIC